MATINISLPDALRKFLEEQVKKCGYSTASEYVRDLLRAAKARTANEHLDRLLLEGIRSGPATPMTSEDWTDIRRELEDFVAKNQKKR